MDKKKESKNYSWQTLQIYWRQAWRYPALLLGMVLSLLAVLIIDAVFPIYLKDLLNLLSSGGDKNTIFQEAVSIIFVLGLFIFGRWVFGRVNDLSFIFFLIKSLRDLSNDCFNILHRHSFSYFNNNFTGTLVKRVNWFTQGFESVIDRLLYRILSFPIYLAIVVYILSGISWYLSVGVVIWVVVFLLVNLIFVFFKYPYDLARNEAESEQTALLADTITNNSSVKLFNGYWPEVHNFGRASSLVARRRRNSWLVGTGFDFFQGFLASVLEVGIFYFSVVLWKQGTFSIGDFVLIQAYLLKIMDEIWGFGRVIRQAYEAVSDANEMTETFLTSLEIEDTPGAKELKITEGVIDYDDVSFCYIDKCDIFKSLNFTISSGEKLAFIGSSGAGKSTLIKLLLRMHNLSGGRILIDGQDISQVTQESLWRNISLVPQDPILFHRSLKENIRYGRPEATDKEIIEASKKARCHDFIIKQENGYDTLVGERGIKLSGGERQRVAIARAILRNAPILVLDEATSSLDSESESLIQEALDELMKGKTVLMIAHRLSTIRKADRILVIEDGGIIESGKHEELIKKKKGIYAKLWQLQAGGFIA
jgi:ATP-binding cassette subfamily B protein